MWLFPFEGRGMTLWVGARMFRAAREMPSPVTWARPVAPPQVLCTCVFAHLSRLRACVQM